MKQVKTYIKIRNFYFLFFSTNIEEEEEGAEDRKSTVNERIIPGLLFIFIFFVFY